MVDDIHLEGGSVLGTSEELPPVMEIVKRLGARRGTLPCGRSLGAAPAPPWRVGRAACPPPGAGAPPPPPQTCGTWTSCL